MKINVKKGDVPESKVVLIVDDNPQILQRLVDWFVQSGRHYSIAVGNVSYAMKILDRQSLRVDAVIAKFDLSDGEGMGEQGGLDVLRYARKARGDKVRLCLISDASETTNPKATDEAVNQLNAEVYAEHLLDVDTMMVGLGL